jgi:pilus assembly protein CpaC
LSSTLPADAYDILVANPAVADSVTRTARRIYLFGKSVGETNIYVFGQNGEQIVSLDLTVERDVPAWSTTCPASCPTPTSRRNWSTTTSC